MLSIKAATTDPATTKADALLVGVLPSGRKGAPPLLAAGAETVDAAFGGALAETLAQLGATGKNGEVTRTAALGLVTATTVVAVGLGDEPDTEKVRRAFGAAARTLAGTSRAALALDGPVVAAAEGLALGAYVYDAQRSSDGPAPLQQVTVLVPDPKAVKKDLDRAVVLARAVATVRDLVNTPPGSLVPEVLAQRARELGEGAGLTVTVMDETELREGGYGGITGVGQGSTNPPRLVRLSYVPARPKGKAALVGKGITFDSGGLSIKPAAAMEAMKSDMAGAASVMAVAIAAAELKLPVAVDAWMGIAENMPSGAAIRPGDVLTMLNGTTVEVLNTDAEGRLVLGDVLVRAAQEEPDVVVDVATLTGAQIVALGSRVAGVMGTDGARTRVHEAAQAAGELTWPMPLPVELRENLDSSVADLQNIGGPQGGMLTAGLFLKEFVPAGVEWAHVDIAGPSFNEKAPWGYTPKGGTGMLVRTLVTMLETMALEA